MNIIELNPYSFKFEDIDVIYPTYLAVDKHNISNNSKSKLRTSKYYNFKNSICRSIYSRTYQLTHRSTQAKLFDLLIDTNYFNIEIIKEMVIINDAGNYYGDNRSYYLLDYFIPSKSLCIELDSDLHDPDRDDLKDYYLSTLGIDVLRIKNFQIDTNKKIEEISEFIKNRSNHSAYIDHSFLLDQSRDHADEMGKSSEYPRYLWDILPEWRKVGEIICEKYQDLKNTLINNKSYTNDYKIEINLDDIKEFSPTKSEYISDYYPLLDNLSKRQIILNIKI